MSIDVESLLLPVGDDGPCGEDLSDLTDYYVLEDLVSGKEETQFSEAEEPEWSKVRDMALQLLGQGKELHVLVWLTNALVETDGAEGLRQGLALLAGTLEQYWDEVFPLLDDEDDNPALERMNCLGDLSASTGRFMRSLRRMPVCESPQLGRFSLRDIQMARGEASPAEGTQAPSMAMIEGAFKDTPPDALKALGDALRAAVEQAGKTDAFLTEKLGADNTSGMTDMMAAMQAILAYIESVETGGGISESDMEAAQDAGEQGGSASPKAAIAGEIGNQGDVIKVLDKVMRWFEQNEPSSPVPLMIGRAKKLVGMNFRDIVKEIATNAESQVEDLFGPEESDD